MNDKIILLFGGTGSLGNEIINKYINNNIIYVYSRDECKQWELEVKMKNPNLKFIMGDIRDIYAVESAICRIKPNIIIIASALKRIDKCEVNVYECVQTNFNGCVNVCNSVIKNCRSLSDNLECVLFVSTDKACNPINAYGMCKALSEKYMIDCSQKETNIKFIVVRYGNVLNSRGSIIPFLHNLGIDDNIKSFTLTHHNMTRFVMTLKQSVELIEYAIIKGENGDIVIPELISMKLKDLFEIFSELYNKPITIIPLRPGEKMLESLINGTQSMSMITNKNEDNGKIYYHIKPFYKNICNIENARDYNSSINCLSKNELKTYLDNLKLL